jgi:hypothetical protein
LDNPWPVIANKRNNEFFLHAVPYPFLSAAFSGAFATQLRL